MPLAESPAVLQYDPPPSQRHQVIYRHHRDVPAIYIGCGKRESVSYQHSMKNRRAVRLLNPMCDKNLKQEPGVRRDDTCDHGLSRSWKVDV